MCLTRCSEDPSTGGAADAESPGADVRTRPDTVDDALTDVFDTGVRDTGTGDDGAEDAAEEEGPVEMLPPMADAGGDITGRAGVPLTFDGSESDDPDGEIESWEWRFGDGSGDAGEVVHYTYTEAGTFIVTLTVTDDTGLTDEAQIVADIEAANEGPSAVIVGPSEVVATEEAEFHGNDSDDDGTIVSFTWDVGVDGVDPIEGAELAYTWEDWGEITLSLTVVDDLEEEDTAERTFDVLSRPTAVITATTDASGLDPVAEATQGETVHFDGSLSSDEDGDVVEWLWEFPDESTQTGPYPDFVFDTLGANDVILTVTDNDGLTDTTDYKMVINEPPNECPTAVISEIVPPSPFDSGTRVSVNASTSHDADGDVDGWVWNWGDESDTKVGPTTNAHTYVTPGTYVITVVVIDDDGCTYVPDDVSTHSARVQTPVVVNNRPPVAVLDVDRITAEPGETINFDTGDSYDPDGTIESRSIDMGNGVTWPLGDDETDKDLYYPDEDTYTAVLTVTDDLGLTDTAEVTITIAEYVPGEYDYNGTWTMGGKSFCYTCAYGTVDYGFGTLDITHAVPAEVGTSVTVTTSSHTDIPGTMAGTFSSPTEFQVTKVFPGGGVCTESYFLNADFADSANGSFRFWGAFGGAYCLDCGTITDTDCPLDRTLPGHKVGG